MKNKLSLKQLERLNSYLSIMNHSRKEANETIKEIQERNPAPEFRNLFITWETGFENWIQDIKNQLIENYKMELGFMVDHLNGAFNQDIKLHFDIKFESEIIDLESFLSLYFDHKSYIQKRLTA